MVECTNLVSLFEKVDNTIIKAESAQRMYKNFPQQQEQLKIRLKKTSDPSQLNLIINEMKSNPKLYDNLIDYLNISQNSVLEIIAQLEVLNNECSYLIKELTTSINTPLTACDRYLDSFSPKNLLNRKHLKETLEKISKKCETAPIIYADYKKIQTLISDDLAFIRKTRAEYCPL